MSTPSTRLSRNLMVDKAQRITALPVGWPKALGLKLGGRIIVDPPVSVEPGIVYRVLIDAETGTATIEAAV